MLFSIILALLILLGGFGLAYRLRDDLRNVSIILTAAVSMAIMVMTFPYFVMENDLTIAFLKTIRYGLGAIGMSIDSDITYVLDMSASIKTIYTGLLYLLYILGPLFGSFFILSFSRTIIENVMMIRHQNIHIFSKFNDRSLALGKSIKENDKSNSIIIYCDQQDLSNNDKIIDARGFHALFSVHKDYELLLLKKKRYYYYVIEDDENDTMIATAKLCEKLLTKKNFNADRISVRSFVSHDSIELIRELDRKIDGSIDLRYIDEINATAIDVLCKCESTFLAHKNNEIVIMGADSLSYAILRNLLNLLNLPDYTYSIHIYDQDAAILAEKLKNQCPALLDKELKYYLDYRNYKEVTYNLHFHELNEDETLADLSRFKDLSAVFVTYDDDHANYNIARKLKRDFASRSDKLEYPLILTAIKDPTLNEFIADEEGIIYFGDISKRYSYFELLTPQIEESARRVHLAYGEHVDLLDASNDSKVDEQIRKLLKEEGFYRYVNQDSSFASAMAMEYRYAYILNTRKKDDETADKEYVENWLAKKANLDAMAVCEHDRWNVYQALQGWRCPNDKQLKNIVSKLDGKKAKDDELLLHPALVPYTELKKTENKVDKLLAEGRKCNYVEADRNILRQMTAILSK